MKSEYLQSSGQFRLRLPKSLHQDLAQEAREQGISLNSYVLYLLSTRFSQEKTWQEATGHYEQRMQETVREVQEMVSSMTLGDSEMEGFAWRNTGSSEMLAQ
ncbi:MAG: toxin-antitoxin system HicB family antitoxin [Desulfohalobiaceae bacterium]